MTTPLSLADYSPEEISRITGAAPRTIRHWIQKPENVPERVLRDLNLFIHGELSTIGGNDWQGHTLRAGLLFIPGWRNGISPEQLKTMFFDCQQARALKNEARNLREELDRRNAELEQLEKKVAFYRAQCLRESHMGLMFTAPNDFT